MSKISDPTVQKAVRATLGEISVYMTQIEAYRDSIKEAIKAKSEEFQIPKKTLRKLATTYHKQNFEKEVESMEEFQDVYESVMGKPVPAQKAP